MILAPTEVRLRMITKDGLKGRTLIVLGVSGLVLCACSKAPTTEIAAADSAMALAVEAGVEEYAPVAYGSAQDLRAQLDAELGIQSEKFALTRSYDHALELANQIKTAADEAAGETALRKEEVRVETTVLLAEVKVALADVQTMHATAPRGKGSAMDLAALKADLDSAAVVLAEGETALNEGRFLEAQTKVLAAQSGALSVRSAIEAAIRGRSGG